MKHHCVILGIQLEPTDTLLLGDKHLAVLLGTEGFLIVHSFSELV